MRTIKSELHVGKTNSGLDLFCDLSLSGSHLYRMKCESFLANLMKIIRMYMGGTSQENFYKGYGTQGWKNITNVVIGSDHVDLYAEGNGYWMYDDRECVIISGLEGIEGLNGQYFRNPEITEFGRLNYYRVRLYNMASKVTGAWNGSSGVVQAVYYGTYDRDNYYTMPLRWQPEIGTSNQPVKASDLGLPGFFIRGNNRGAVSISSLLTDQESAKFTISRPFTNESGVLKEVHEIGLMSSDYANDHMLMARDILDAPISLDATKTLSLDYEVNSFIDNFNQDTDLNGTNGGWTDLFLSALHRIARPDSAHNFGTEYLFACGLGGGGCGINYDSNRVKDGWRWGVRVGTSNKFVSMTDRSLNPDSSEINGVPHGYGDGQLVHHGTHIGQLVVDDLAGEVYFPVERIFENRGSTDITVGEIGLFANRNYSSNIHPHLFARKALAPVDQFTIQPGQAVKIAFICKALV